jgi:hypothetical protein
MKFSQFEQLSIDGTTMERQETKIIYQPFED